MESKGENSKFVWPSKSLKARLKHTINQDQKLQRAFYLKNTIKGSP